MVLVLLDMKLKIFKMMKIEHLLFFLNVGEGTFGETRAARVIYKIEPTRSGLVKLIKRFHEMVYLFSKNGNSGTQLSQITWDIPEGGTAIFIHSFN